MKIQVISSCCKILQMCKDQSNRDHKCGVVGSSRHRCEFARVIYKLFHFCFPVLLWHMDKSLKIKQLLST